MYFCSGNHQAKNMNPTPKNLDWKTLKSEYLFRRPWLTARRDTCEMPDGRINDEYYVLEYPTWVHVVAVTKEGRMVIIRQYRHGLGRTCYEIVAGCAEDGEDPLEAAKWLEKNRPDYREIVTRTINEMKEEIRANRARLVGA